MAETVNGKIIPIAVEDEVKTAYLNYAMSVIVARALPDVRDGLKPVHRRLLYSMDELGLHPNATTKKSARIVGDAMGKYHPHGDASLYDAMVRMAQDFSLRYPVVQGQGNFGSIDGDPPAAMRYTEAKLSRIGEEMLQDLKKDTVDFVPNYDESLMEPTVLPAAVPNLLINGSSGIAVGMATNMAPHNLREVCAGVCAYLDNPDISCRELMHFIKGPDFPTGGIIYGTKGIEEVYQTGRGKILVRGQYTVETNAAGRENIVFTEIPYAVNKLTLIEHISELIRNHVIDGISNHNDESDRDGIRIVITVKRGASLKMVINQLFARTALQSSFSVQNLALVDGRPKTLSLKELIRLFVEHRVVVITRRAQFDLNKAQERTHILNGLITALTNIDEVVATIRASADVPAASAALTDKFHFSPAQVQAIIDMRLGRLSNLEYTKLKTELQELNVQIVYLQGILADQHKLYEVIREEIITIAARYGDDRRTELVNDEPETIEVEDLIKKEEMIVLISSFGYIKRVPVSAYRSQRRGGKGMMSAKLTEDDSIVQLFIASTHEYILFITNVGKAYWMKVHEIPEGSRIAKGAYIKTILNLSEYEEISAIVSLEQFTEDQFLFMGTASGMVKKTSVTDFSRAKTRGITAINLKENDRLVGTLLTHGDDEIVLISRLGKALRTHEDQIRATGRTSQGVIGMKFHDGDELIGILRVTEDESIVLISEHGYGKRITPDEFMSHGRHTGGQKIYTVNEKTGALVGCAMVREDEELMGITNQGKTIRVSAQSISMLGRAASGVRILNIDEPDFVIGVDRIAKEEEVEDSTL
ncbi:DNA gyrase subunit A [Spirochaetia bacterium]|nr:DNA gyrase subunit A [Spirochaetia bacterium]GHU29439.1 DNA gyrase subunit A [Spirochaetia bacterium]